MNITEFSNFAQQGFNRIPIVKTVLADTETPLTAYLKLASGPYSYLFESVEGGEKWGRYSIIGLNASERIEISGNQVKKFIGSKLTEDHSVEDPLNYVREYKAQFKVPEIDGLPEFNGGLVGYFGYDTVRMIEPKLSGHKSQDDLGVPDILLMLSEDVLVFDNLQGKMHIITNADPSQIGAYEASLKKLDSFDEKLRSSVVDVDKIEPKNLSGKTKAEQLAVSCFGQSDFMQAVDTIKDYILAGDAMQVVLSQRMTAPFHAKPINLYRALRSLNPSPYMYFMDLGDHQVVGSSPEILARLKRDDVTVRPIAGTRRRGYSEEEDLKLEQDLVNDPKEIAEHLMLIDLGRNDVGRIAKVGSVELTEKMVVERFSHVLHITSNVVGKLLPEKDAVDVLKAAHPAGTLSGAPKIRAMEIIDELEDIKRSIYGGAVGYIGWDGNLDLAIAIRTAVIKGAKVYVQAGAGVVADSVPELEWKETMNKARAVFSAVDWVSE